MVESYLKLPRNVYLLSVAQILGMSATTMVVLVGGIIGAEIAPSPTLATLPATLMLVGLAISIIPAAMFMKRIGRKKGFIISSLLSIFATLFAAYAISQQNFFQFCIATLLLGSNGAFVQQYRFAALESVSKALASKAVSIVLFAGILAGVLGPEIAKRTKNIFELPDYSGSFIVMSGLFLLAILLLLLMKDTRLLSEETEGKERPLPVIVKQPSYLLAILAALVGYGVMVFIMTATPIHLHNLSHYSFDQTAFVIQSHVIAMFLPSLFTGILIERFGIFRILVSGLIFLLTTVALAVSAHSLLPYWVALMLLGIGWNFLFISSTLLLSNSYFRSERFKAQGVNDFIVVLSQMLASFLAGSFLFTIGWINLNLLTIPLILGAFIIFHTYRKTMILAPKKT